jgi:hypothetical protein
MSLPPTHTQPAPTPPLGALPVLASAPLARRSAFVAAALGWLLPGLGQIYVGRPGKAFLMFVAIGGLFYLGLYLTGFTCVNPQTYSLEFAAHAFLGGPTAAAYLETRDLVITQPMPWFEVGRLYAAVAGLLNVVAICDALGEVLAHNKRVRVQNDLRRRFLAERQRELERLVEARARAEAAAQLAAQTTALSTEEEPLDPGAGALDLADPVTDEAEPEAWGPQVDPEAGAL